MQRELHSHVDHGVRREPQRVRRKQFLEQCAAVRRRGVQRSLKERGAHPIHAALRPLDAEDRQQIVLLGRQREAPHRVHHGVHHLAPHKENAVLRDLEQRGQYVISQKHARNVVSHKAQLAHQQPLRSPVAFAQRVDALKHHRHFLERGVVAVVHEQLHHVRKVLQRVHAHQRVFIAHQRDKHLEQIIRRHAFPQHPHRLQQPRRQVPPRLRVRIARQKLRNVRQLLGVLLRQHRAHAGQVVRAVPPHHRPVARRDRQKRSIRFSPKREVRRCCCCGCPRKRARVSSPAAAASDAGG
mmetsp:Transcript_5574/g.11738  ORF Transcript_5574/g.11738 Transcript_5574/m.11738 type:complete len:297 (+) Transcript_5574:649-1539(+)